MGCGCHSAKKAQPIRRSVVTKASPNGQPEPILRNVYRSGNITRKKIIRRTISH